MEGISGNRGPVVRSDCFVSIHMCESGGIQTELKSKTSSLFGRQVEQLSCDMMQHFGILHARIFIEDSGALPYVIAARIEAALNGVTRTDKPYLLPAPDLDHKATRRDHIRRSRLYLPGDHPKLMINAGLYGADAIILDLEDSVAPAKKHDARFLVRNALLNNDFKGSELMVRINQLPAGLDDLPFIVPGPVHLVLIPKCESAGTVKLVDDRIQVLKRGDPRPVWLMPVIESAKGIIHAHEIATASEHVAALAIGLEDFTADIGAERTAEGMESFYARSALVVAARAAGIQPIDSVFSDFEDKDQLHRVATRSRSMGFSGMGCIHPAQISIVNQCFNPSEKEIDMARKIVRAFEEAKTSGAGVIAVGSRMIDAAVVKRALQTIHQAEANHLLNVDWRENHEG